MTRLDVTKTYKLFINGAFPRSESGRSIVVHGARGEVMAHIAHGSRKDLRDAVEAASAAQPKWADATAYNRAQVLYRMAEMMEGKRREFVDALRETSTRQKVNKSARAAKTRSNRAATVMERNRAAGVIAPETEVAAAIDRLVCFAGWADKYAQVLGCNNPVAGPYYNFTVPEPTGVVGVIAPEAPPLLGLISLIAPPLCAGNSIVAVAPGGAMLPAAVFGEVCATSDVPPGVINIITSPRSDLLQHLATHRNVNAISAANLARDEATTLKLGIAENLKRVHIADIKGQDWLDPRICEGPQTIEPFVEFKTIWHPSAV